MSLPTRITRRCLRFRLTVWTVGGGAGRGAAKIVPAASRDDTLPMLTAVCLTWTRTLTLAAADRYRLAVRELGGHRRTGNPGVAMV